MRRAFRIEIPDWMSQREDRTYTEALDLALVECEDAYFTDPKAAGERRLKTYTSECSRFVVWEGSYEEGFEPGFALELALMEFNKPRQ